MNKMEIQKELLFMGIKPNIKGFTYIARMLSKYYRISLYWMCFKFVFVIVSVIQYSAACNLPELVIKIQ